MVQPGTVWVVFVSRWWRSLTVDKIEWIAREGVGGVEDAAWPLCRFTSLNTVDVVFPGLIGIESFWLGDVERYIIICL